MYYYKKVVDIKDLQLLWVHRSCFEPGTTVKKHTHDFFHLISIIDGTMRYCLGDQEYSLKKGDTVIAGKGVPHQFSNDSSDPVYYYELKFTPLSNTINRILSSLEERIYQDEFVANLVGNIADEYLQDRTLKDESAAAALKTLVYYLTADARSISGGESGVIDTTGFSPLSKRVIALMSERYAENITLDDISEGVGATKNYLCNAFKRNTGMTIIDCLNMIRIRKAAELIVYSDLPLVNVAQMCGYVSASHFNRVFMRYIGIPPGQCRKAYAREVLFKPSEPQKRSDLLFYSVLAGKRITSDIINSYYEQSKLEKSDEDGLSDEE